jgi:AP-3 complex subunit beta
VAESVVVIKHLLQMGAGENDNVVLHLAKLIESITIPNARASIVWVVGEYCEKIPLYAPDILRKLAKGFINEVRSTLAMLDASSLQRSH